MLLYLVQHAAAKSKTEDEKRSLTDDGRENVRKIATFAAYHLNINVNKIYHSGKTRAMQTAEVLERHLNPSQGIVQAEDLEPNASALIWAKRLATTAENTMLVGHLPHLNKLASLLLCDDEDMDIVSFENTCIICLEKSDLGKWSLKWMVIPSII